MGALAVGLLTGRIPLALWSAFILAFAGLSYGIRLSQAGTPDRDLLYKWATVGADLFQFLLILGIVYAIAGLGERRRLFALRRPTSWRLAAAIGVGVVVAVLVLEGTLGRVLHAGREQGLTPASWEPRHAAAYVANGIVIAVVAPFVEELTFRGLGYSLLARFGRWTAILLVGLLFALAHGLVEGLPFFFVLGAGLAYLRSRVDSVYPGMLVHGLFNLIALVAAVAA